jgi:hypothetical protein
VYVQQPGFVGHLALQVGVQFRQGMVRHQGRDVVLGVVVHVPHKEGEQPEGQGRPGVGHQIAVFLQARVFADVVPAPEGLADDPG